MTHEQLVVAEIKKHIATLAEEERIRVEVIASTFRNIVRHGGPEAGIALALVGAEFAAEE